MKIRNTILKGCRKKAVLNAIKNKTTTIQVKDSGAIQVITNNAIYQATQDILGGGFTVIRLKKFRRDLIA